VPFPILNLINVSLVRDNRYILKRISWAINEGENWVLIGANGAGKTTLIKVISGYMWPTSGEVYVLGEKFGKVNLRELRRKIGIVSSDLFRMVPETDTVLEIVLSGKFASFGLYDTPSKMDLDVALKIIKFIGCKGLEKTKFSNLSSGEQQKVLIARALMANPKLLILDEPCVNLDIASRENFLKVVDSICQERKHLNVIFITHHLEEIMPSFTHAIILKEGEVVAQGNIENVLTDRVISDAFNVKVKIHKNNSRYWVEILS